MADAMLQSSIGAELRAADIPAWSCEMPYMIDARDLLSEPADADAAKEMSKVMTALAESCARTQDVDASAIQQAAQHFALGAARLHRFLSRFAACPLLRIAVHVKDLRVYFAASDTALYDRAVTAAVVAWNAALPAPMALVAVNEDTEHMFDFNNGRLADLQALHRGFAERGLGSSDARIAFLVRNGGNLYFGPATRTPAIEDACASIVWPAPDESRDFAKTRLHCALWCSPAALL